MCISTILLVLTKTSTTLCLLTTLLMCLGLVEVANAKCLTPEFQIVEIANSVNFVNQNYGLPAPYNFDILFGYCSSHRDIALCKIYSARPSTLHSTSTNCDMISALPSLYNIFLYDRSCMFLKR